ncbi:hypothetical protein CR513_16804, partial [Mucuna pruriens]
RVETTKNAHHQWSSKGLAIPTASSFPHLGRYKAHVYGEVLLSIQDCNHSKGDMWDQATLRRNIARIL